MTAAIKAPNPELLARLEAIPGFAVLEERWDGLWISAPHLDPEAMAREMNALGFRLATMTGSAAEAGETQILYHFVQASLPVHFKTTTRGNAIRSITPLVRAAAWIEREIHDFFGVRFEGHPNLVPLLRPAEVSEGFFRVPGVAAREPNTP